MLGDGTPSACKAPDNGREAVSWPKEKERQKVGGHAGSHSQDGHARDTCGLFYPQCTTVWCLESERDWNNLGTKQREERESCLRDHRVPCWGPTLCSTSEMLCSKLRKIPVHKVSGKRLSEEMKSGREILSRVLLHSTLKQTLDATVLH